MYLLLLPFHIQKKSTSLVIFAKHHIAQIEIADGLHIKSFCKQFLLIIRPATVHIFGKRSKFISCAGIKFIKKILAIFQVKHKICLRISKEVCEKGIVISIFHANKFILII